MPPTFPAAGAPGAAITAAAGALSVPGHALRVAVGQEVAARVVAVAGGVVDLAVAGGHVSARTTLPLQAGQTLRLVVSSTDGERVTLRPAAAEGGGAPARATALGALRAAGLAAPAAAAVLAALAESGAAPPRAETAALLGARAAQAGVTGRSQATAFVRLDAAGLPTTPAAVAGLAALADGPPLGRALAGVIDAACAVAPVPPPTGAAGEARPAAGASTPAAPTATTASTAHPSATVPAATHGATPPPGAVPPAERSAALGAALAVLVDRVARGAVSGDVAALRAAVAALGPGLEARLAAGERPREAPVRALLLALASHPGTEPALARAAAGLADAVGAQPLAANAGTPPPPGAPAGGGAYLQLPLPGGGTAEVRIDSDALGGGTDGSGQRRIAFLLRLSALGSVTVTATAGAGAVDARVRTGDEGVRSFLSDNSSELAAALGADGAPARVQVDAVARPTPERLIAPPAASGLDRRA